MSRIFKIRFPLLKAAILQTAYLSILLSVIFMAGSLLTGDLTNASSIVLHYLTSITLGLQIALLVSLPYLLESFIKLPNRDNRPRFLNDTLIVLLASLVFFSISLAFSLLDLFGHINTSHEAVFHALFLAALFVTMNLFLRLPWLRDEESYS